MAPLLEFHSIGEHGEGSGGELEFGLVGFGGLWPGEGAFFQSLGHEPEPAAIPVKDLEAGAGLVGEDEEGAGAHILFQVFGNKPEQTIITAAHIAGCERDEDAQAASKTKHINWTGSWHCRPGR